MKLPDSVVPGIAPQRLIGLADGVFAIVMTILVLELGIPLVTEASAHGGLTQMLLEMWPEFLFYGLSFLVLGIFWFMHHAIFDSIKRYDPTLAWINIVFLMFVALIPFSTALYGEHGAEQVTARVYGVNMLLPFFLLWLMFLYATSNHRLVDTDIDPNVVKGGKIMGFVYFALILLALGISFVSPVASFAIYGFIVVADIILTAIGKWELVMTWPGARKSNPAGDTENE
jgi:uncharacterized membrane protein